MKKRSLQAALRIALIKEEFTQEEISEAIDLFQMHDSTEDLLEYISGRKNIQEGDKPPARRRKDIDEQRSQAILKLEKIDPEKYQILSEFDLMLRRGDLLSDLSDIRRLGEELRKDFSARNSRRDLISKFIEVLADIAVSDIKVIIQRAISMSKLQESEYQQLAAFIISGAKNSTS